MLDVTATFFITSSLAIYYFAKEFISNTRTRLLYLSLSGVLIGLAIMTKGVVGFLPFVVIGLYEIYLYVFRYQKISMREIFGYLALLVFSALVYLPWHIQMYRAFGDSFINTYIGYHVLERATSSIEDKGRPFFWYLVVLKVSMRLWFVALLAAFPFVLFRSFRKDKKSAFLMIWALAIFLFFSAATSKLVWYIIPIYPVLAIIVGVFISKVVDLVSFKSLLVKFLIIYLVVFAGLVYLMENKRLVYTGDLTGKQVRLIKEKNKLYGDEVRLYADRIELPLLLFYTDGPFTVVDFTPLKEILELAPRNEPVVFITKESRFGAYKEWHPDLRLIDQRDEWVLGELPAFVPVVPQGVVIE
jgi:4-amino-4-deoxy-L-arabinose transferase-like glycosyltransferase